jgi:hypothetical protein
MGRAALLRDADLRIDGIVHIDNDIDFCAATFGTHQPTYPPCLEAGEAIEALVTCCPPPRCSA